MAGISIFPTSVNVNIPTANNPSTFVKDEVLVVESGTAVQGPNLVVAPGKQMVVMANRNNMATLFVANSEASVANAQLRVALNAGESLQFSLQFANAVWFDASANGVIADLIVETA